MSAALLSQPAAVAIPTPIGAHPAPASPTKKRRRRAPATGAAEDCFTCRSHGVKCDRRRPYCGPCLDSNQTCNGYRTQLTWGVGVASRGKLRGLSLPVINAVTEQQRKDRLAKRADEKSGEKARKLRTVGAGTPGYGSSQRNSPPSNATKINVITNYDFVNMEHPASSPTTSSIPTTAAAGIGRSSSAMSAPMSAGSPVPSSIPSMAGSLPPQQRMPQAKRSPQLNMASYSPVSQPAYHSPVLSQPSLPRHHHHHHVQQQQQRQQQRPLPPPQPSQQHYSSSPSANVQYIKPDYQKAQYSHVNQQQHSPTMLMTPMSEYESNYSHPHSPHSPHSPHTQQFSMSSAPTSQPLYDLVSAVSTSYQPSPATTVTSSSGMSFASIPAPMPAPRMMQSGGNHQNSHHHQHQHQHQQQQHGGHSWNSPALQQHVGPGHNNLSELLYEDDMLGSF